MDDHAVGCIICGHPLEYSDKQVISECSICHGSFLSNARCVKGHYVCDRCHLSGALSIIGQICMETDSKDPIEILNHIMGLPGIHMHGPEHHVLVGSSLIAAYRNAGGDIDLEYAIKEMQERGGQVPGGICGTWGTCGAAVSCGIAYSIIHGTSPLSGESWAKGNKLTSGCLSAISRYGGPRCCKRDAYTALVEAVSFIRKNDGVKMELPRKIACRFHDLNRQCLGKNCPYHRD